MYGGTRKFSWWGAFLSVLAIAASLIGTTAFDENWLWVAVIASLFAPCFMLGIKFGDGEP
jgi:nicotinamide riboside transporter PnuC